MRLTRVTVLLAAGLVAVAGTAAGTALAAPSAPAAHARPVVLVQCNGKGQVRPAGTDRPGCMPSNELITGFSWTSWRSAAFGAGTLRVNNCTPSSSCGPSKFTKYPFLVVLWHSKPCAHHPGQRFFSEMTLIFTGKRPPGPVAQTIGLRS
jgi:hypothetical protein